MNLDAKNEMIASVEDAIKNGDTTGFVNQMFSFMEETENKLKADYEALKDEKDEQILASRGVFKLTKAETDFYNKLISKVRNTDQSLSNVDLVMPKETINRVFDELRIKHPLLDKVDFVNTQAVTTDFLVNTGITGTAGWGELCSAVDDEIKSGFAHVEVKLNKLSAYMYVCLTAIELGMEWLDRYCRECLAEAIALALEDAIINGTGSNMPIGMTKTIASAGQSQTIPAQDKSATAITALDVATLGGIAYELTNSGKRDVGTMLMVVNPADYYALVLPAIRLMNAEGKYVEYLPFPVDIVISTKVASHKAIFGIAKNYWLGVGLGKDGKLTESDHYKFLDDLRCLKQKLVAGGQPKDNSSFVVKDITNLKPAYISVREVSI